MLFRAGFLKILTMKKRMTYLLLTALIVVSGFSQTCGFEPPPEPRNIEFAKNDFAIEQRPFILPQLSKILVNIYVTRWYVDKTMTFESEYKGARKFYAKRSGEHMIKARVFKKGTIKVSVWNEDTRTMEVKYDGPLEYLDGRMMKNGPVLQAYHVIRPFRGSRYPDYLTKLIDKGHNKRVDEVEIKYRVQQGLEHSGMSAAEMREMIDYYIEFYGAIWHEQTGDYVVPVETSGIPDIDITNQYTEDGWLAATYTSSGTQVIIFNNRYVFGASDEFYSFLRVFGHEKSHVGHNTDHDKWKDDTLMQPSMGRWHRFEWDEAWEMHYLRSNTYWLLNR